MTLSEFKAWLDGFEAAMGDAPTADQWAKIKAKLAEAWEAPKSLPIAPYRGDQFPNPNRWPIGPIVTYSDGKTPKPVRGQIFGDGREA